MEKHDKKWIIGGYFLWKWKKWIIGGLLVLLSVFFIVIFIISSVVTIISVIGGEESQGRADISMEGMPPFITQEMVEALLEMQDTYGHPVSTGLAQIIAESGFGQYGPGGESGQGLSRLAYEQKNLFGIKYFSGDQYATGAYDYSTGEQDASGNTTTIIAGFSIYPSYTDCIKQRAWMLERSPYAEHVSPYKRTGEGAYSKYEADNFMRGIREAGWATDLSYVERCISLMEQYDLYKYDNMSLEGFQNSANSSPGGDAAHGEEYNKATAAQKAIVDTAYATPFAGDGWCAAWVSRVFNNAGQPYPGGNANSFTMSRESGELKVGMAICVEHSGSRPQSWTYGHIGIYIGDGQVMHNESSSTGNLPNGCTITPLEEWKATYEYQCTAYYGWVNSIDLSQR